MPVNDREPDEKGCSFRLIVILFPYKETVFVINLRRGNYQVTLSNLIPLKVIIYSKMLICLGVIMKFYPQNV
jgi:hypothetical protein